MRVLQVDTERGWRGGQRQTLLVARGLAHAGHRCIVAARADEPLAERAAAAGLAVVPVRPRSELALGSALRLRRLIRREGIDIVHAQAAHALSLAALATLGTDARVVVTRHLAKRLRNNAATRWKYARAAAILAVSDAAADALVASGIPRGRVEVVHGGVELERLVTPAPRERLAALGIPAGVPLAAMVGALVPQKDPLTFVRATAAARRIVPGLHALVVGDGGLRTNVESEVHALGLHEVVHFAGFRTDVDELLAAADLVVLSSRFEGLPLVIMDAFALGVPVAATAGEGIPELVDDGETGLLAPVGDHEALGTAMARLLRDRALRARVVDAARTRVRDFSIERTVARTIAAYERVLGRTSGDARGARAAVASSASSASETRAP